MKLFEIDQKLLLKKIAKIYRSYIAFSSKLGNDLEGEVLGRIGGF